MIVTYVMGGPDDQVYLSSAFCSFFFSLSPHILLPRARGGPLNVKLCRRSNCQFLKKLEHQEYLGVSGSPGELFAVKDIDTDILLIELFSMYCPFCQEEAPSVNELYEMIAGSSCKRAAGEQSSALGPGIQHLR